MSTSGSRNDAACDRFEAEWRAGHRPRIELYLGQVPGPERPGLLSELLAVELYRRREAAESPALEEYLARFRGPDFADVIGKAFADDGYEVLLPESSPAAAEFKVPAALVDHPRYRVGKKIGGGGMGRVYRARHLVMERDVAIKVINRDLTLRAGQRFLREIQGLGRLHPHDHIVTAFDAEQAGITLFLVMELVKGYDLDKLVERGGPLPPGEACDVARQAALGLQHAHELGMVHRDIKPRNLMRTPSGQVKILDFGLARLASELGPDGEFAGPGPMPGLGTSGSTSPARPGHRVTASGVMMGTPDYIAPEQAVDAHDADIRADIYSLGCTLYFLLAGKPPFPDGNPIQKVQRHFRSRPQPVGEIRTDLPPGLERVLDRMMAKNRKHRYQTPAEVAEALSPFARTRRWPRRSRVTALAALSTLFVGCVLFALKDFSAQPVLPIQMPPQPPTRPEGPRGVVDLRLMSWGDGSGVPTSGTSLVVVGTDNTGSLHIRIFDAAGNRITDAEETKLPDQAAAISTLKQRLPGLLPPHTLTVAEKAEVVAKARSIVDNPRPGRPDPVLPPIETGAKPTGTRTPPPGDSTTHSNVDTAASKIGDRGRPETEAIVRATETLGMRGLTRHVPSGPGYGPNDVVYISEGEVQVQKSDVDLQNLEDEIGKNREKLMQLHSNINYLSNTQAEFQNLHDWHEQQLQSARNDRVKLDSERAKLVAEGGDGNKKRLEEIDKLKIQIFARSSNAEREIAEANRQIKEITKKLDPIEREHRFWAQWIEENWAKFVSGWVDLRQKTSSVLRRYAELNNDPEVKKALAELNKPGRGRSVLGPVRSYGQFIGKVRADAIETLGLKGLVPQSRGRSVYVLNSELRLVKQAAVLRAALEKLAKAEAMLAEASKALPASQAERRGWVAGSDKVAPQESPGSAERARVLIAVLALGEMAVQVGIDWPSVRVDEQVKAAIAELNKRKRKSDPDRARIAEVPEAAEARELLEEVREKIRLQDVPVLRKGGMILVAASVKDLAPEMVVAPDRAGLLLSKASADRFGVVATSGAATVPVELPNGRFPARPATLPSLRLGPVELADVPCRVLPPEAGDPAPMLGTMALGLSAAYFDQERMKLHLARFPAPRQDAHDAVTANAGPVPRSPARAAAIK